MSLVYAGKSSLKNSRYSILNHTGNGIKERLFSQEVYKLNENIMPGCPS